MSLTACSRITAGLSVLPVLLVLSTSWVGAQSPSGQLPRKLTLAQEGGMLVRRNLQSFVHNDRRAGITQAEADVKAAEALVKHAELQATTDAEKACQSHLTARRMLDLYNSQNLALVENPLQTATHRYREGASSLIELLDALRPSNQTLTAYNQARADYQSGLWQLEQATGHSPRQIRTRETGLLKAALQKQEMLCRRQSIRQK